MWDNIIELFDRQTFMDNVLIFCFEKLDQSPGPLQSQDFDEPLPDVLFDKLDVIVIMMIIFALYRF